MPLCPYAPMPPANLLRLRSQDRIDHRQDLQHALRLADRDLGEAVGHERFSAVLFPPPADVAVLADLADRERAGRGAALLAQLHHEKVAVLDPLVAEVLAAGAKDDLPFFDEGLRDADGLTLRLVDRTPLSQLAGRLDLLPPCSVVDARGPQRRGADATDRKPRKPDGRRAAVV